MMGGGPESIADLLPLVPNDYQRDILRKLQLRHESFQMYLSGYEKNTSADRKRAGIEGVCTVLGTMKKGVRESYEIKLYRAGADPKGSFWCSCPDHKFSSSRKGTCCKHISFVVCRVAKMFDPAFFATKRLQPAQLALLVKKLEDTMGATFVECRRPVEDGDVCPICFDDLDVGDRLSCPTCQNNVHKACMEVWMEKRPTCVFCRSDWSCH